MRKPHIYIHRAGEWYGLYMNAENEARLREFATVTTGGTRTEPFSPTDMVRELTGVDGILSLNGLGATEITTDVLNAVGTVKVAAIAHWWHGGHVAAAPMWRAAGLEVIDASDATTDAVVEWVIGAAIMGVRRLVEFDRALKAGSLWAEPGRRDAGLLGKSVVGLVGVGRVGRVAASRFRDFGATLIGYDPLLSDEDAQALGIRRVSLEELLTSADVISLHMAVTDATRGLLGAREFGLIKDGAVFINSARSAILDTPALIAELRKNRFHAFLDVYDTEPLPLDDPLRSLENVFLTPHIAGDTFVMFQRCGRKAIKRLREHFEKDYIVSGNDVTVLRGGWVNEAHRMFEEAFRFPWNAHLRDLNARLGLSGDHRFATHGPRIPPAWFNGDIEALEPGRWVLVVSLNPHRTGEPETPSEPQFDRGFTLQEYWDFWRTYNTNYWYRRFYGPLAQVAAGALGEGLTPDQERAFATERMLFLELCPYASARFGLRTQQIVALSANDPGFRISSELLHLIAGEGKPALILVNGNAAVAALGASDSARVQWSSVITLWWTPLSRH